jgi:hypothetical protein
METTSLTGLVPNHLVACNRKHINCTVSDGKIEADAEIAGVGVCVSFRVPFHRSQ